MHAASQVFGDGEVRTEPVQCLDKLTSRDEVQREFKEYKRGMLAKLPRALHHVYRGEPAGKPQAFEGGPNIRDSDYQQVHAGTMFPDVGLEVINGVNRPITAIKPVKSMKAEPLRTVTRRNT